MCGGLAVFVLMLVLLVQLVLSFRRQSTQLKNMQAPQHHISALRAVLSPYPSRLPMSHFRSPHTPLWTVHCGCASNLWQMELTRLGSRSVTLNNDDEPEKPGPAGESVHAELLAAPLPELKMPSVHI